MEITCTGAAEYGTIIYYSHLVPLFLTIVLAIFTLRRSHFSYLAIIFSLFALSFCFWLFFDLIAWVATDQYYDLISAVWGSLDYMNVLFYLFGLYFFVLAIKENDIHPLGKLFLALSAIPAWWITITNDSIIAFNQPDCEAINNNFLSNYKLGLEVIVIGFILFYGFFKARNSNRDQQIKALIVSLGITLFFGIFSTTEYIASQTGIYEINLYSLFILPVFLLIIIYSVTNLEIFKIKLIGSQLLAYALIIMVGSQFFFLENTTDRLLTAITFVLSFGFGILLIRSARKEENARIKIEELDRQKDAVVHMVAHQFKGPVTTINFTTELLLDGTYGDLSADQKEHIGTIREASQKMGSQSEMVLDAAKISSGKLPIEPKQVDLNALLKEVVTEAENHAKERKVNLKVSLPGSALPAVMLDPKYTQLSLDNLLSNAIKYTALKSQGGDVDFSVEMKNNTLFVTVKDAGIGIPKKDQEHIFKELFRASNSGKEGTGLGLHVAVGAIEAQGGKIWFESEENKGTTFFVELPLKLATT